MPQEEWDFETQEDLEEFQKEWDDQFGDRMQEIVLIGKDLDKESLTVQLDACLLTQKELSKSSKYWESIGDNFGDSSDL